SAYFSGFALKNNFRLFDKAFPLSDHADFKQLLRYVEQSNAKRIYTYHGFAKEFASYLNKKGYSAKVLSRQNVLNYC
ncbi:MAG: exonuclease, partial [Candidatus Iainarchaeum archaeon]